MASCVASAALPINLITRDEYFASRLGTSTKRRNDCCACVDKIVFRPLDVVHEHRADSSGDGESVVHTHSGSMKSQTEGSALLSGLVIVIPRQGSC